MLRLLERCLKNSEYSEHSNEKTLLRISNDALNIGTRYLDDCLEYLKYIKLLPCCLNKTDRNGRIKNHRRTLKWQRNIKQALISLSLEHYQRLLIVSLLL